MAYALRDDAPLPDYNYLDAAEKHRIRKILKETLPGLPSWWR
jgi:hypothetical protein